MASASISMLQKTGNNVHSDECYTPKEAILPLLKFLPKGVHYYECTSDKSNSIVTVMLERDYLIYPSNGRNFLTDDMPPEIDVIITNPPYSKKDKFIRRCYDLDVAFALLLPVSSLQGQTRGKMFDKYGIELLVLNKRIDFTGGGSPHFGCAWFCHNILPKPLMFI